MSNVYLVTTGDGSDGDEWNVHGIFATQEAADTFVREASRNCCYEVEEWGVHGSTLTDAERDAVARLRNESYCKNDENCTNADMISLTEEEREAIEAAIAYMQPVAHYDNRPQATLRTLLERLT